MKKVATIIAHTTLAIQILRSGIIRKLFTKHLLLAFQKPLPFQLDLKQLQSSTLLRQDPPHGQNCPHPALFLAQEITE